MFRVTYVCIIAVHSIAPDRHTIIWGIVFGLLQYGIVVGMAIVDRQIREFQCKIIIQIIFFYNVDITCIDDIKAGHFSYFALFTTPKIIVQLRSVFLHNNGIALL